MLFSKQGAAGSRGGGGGPGPKGNRGRRVSFTMTRFLMQSFTQERSESLLSSRALWVLHNVFSSFTLFWGFSCSQWLGSLGCSFGRVIGWARFCSSLHWSMQPCSDSPILPGGGDLPATDRLIQPLVWRNHCTLAPRVREEVNMYQACQLATHVWICN